MSKRIIIDPVTRIEGHAKISIFVDDAGAVTDAQFHVVEFRGFEKFCEGRMFWEMPAITARICPVWAGTVRPDGPYAVRAADVSDTAELLAEAGYDRERIARLVEEGAVA